MERRNPDEERKALVERLLWKAHEQSLTSPERSPFWRDGPWRCEFHRSPGKDRLKVFSGDRCVHEELVQGKAGADVRARELRRVVARRSAGGHA